MEHKGRLTGLVTVKDCLKYQFRLEAREEHRANQTGSPSQDEVGGNDRLERRIWNVFRKVGGGVGERVGRWSGGRIKLGSDDGLLTGRSRDPRDEREGLILDGTEDDEVELEEEVERL